ncbi:MAG: hypothetical protein B6226_05370 [Candidatus Cloacimonetes bacterium 4572_65]|nr:MAG: hypothetical protein B6226_05370 [Candidatus Cloacimonetes bacterium 4572_65]
MKIDPYIENKQDSLTIKANKMEYFEDFDKIVATFSVETILKEASVFSDFLIYYNEEGRALFTGQPRLETDFGTGIAESFNLFFVEDEIDRVEFVNDCRLDFSFEEDGEEAQDNWLKADKINISFAEGDPSKIDAHDNISYLFITEEEKRRTKEYVANRSSSDFLELYIDEDLKIEQIQQEKNIRGTYIFKSAKRIIKK